MTIVCLRTQFNILLVHKSDT